MRLLGWTLNQSDILIRRDQDTDTHRGKTSCLPGWAQGEGSHLQAEGRPWKEQTLDSRTEKIPFHDLSHPDSGTLLWQPEQTDRGLASHTDKFSLIQLCSAPGSVPPGSSPSILSCLPPVQARPEPAAPQGLCYSSLRKPAFSGLIMLWPTVSYWPSGQREGGDRSWCVYLEVG